MARRTRRFFMVARRERDGVAGARSVRSQLRRCREGRAGSLGPGLGSLAALHRRRFARPASERIQRRVSRGIPIRTPLNRSHQHCPPPK